MVDINDKVGVRDDRESFRGAAQLVNKFRIHNSGSNVRLSFLEESADGAIVSFRTAVTLSHSDFLDLVKIVNMIGEDLGKDQ